MATVLLAEDDAAVRFALALLLRDAGGHDVFETNCCDARLEALAATKPEIVALETSMPGMTFAELVERIRRIDAEIGIVAISGGGMHQDPEFAASLARMAGADRALHKPVRNEYLLTEIDGLLAAADKS